MASKALKPATWFQSVQQSDPNARERETDVSLYKYCKEETTNMEFVREFYACVWMSPVWATPQRRDSPNVFLHASAECLTMHE